MTTILIGVLSGVALFAAFRTYDERAIASLIGLAGAVGLSFAAWLSLRNVALPDLSVSWQTFAGLAAFVLLAMSTVGMYRLGAIGVGFAAWFLHLTLALSNAWPLVLVVLGVLALLAYSDEDGKRWMAIIAGVSLFAGMFIGIKSVDWNKMALRATLSSQLEANNQVFTGWADYCAKAQPGSSDQMVCDKVNELDGRVSTLETKVKTLEGQMATVVEKIDAGGVTIKSPGGDADQTAAKILAESLSSVGWGPDDIRINAIDERIHIDQRGYNSFVDQRLRTKADLVAYLNSSDPAAVANRELLLAAVPADQHTRLLSGEGYYTLQFTQASCLDGNAYYKDGKAQVGGQICHEAGDILHVYVGSDGVIYWGATVRADCGNGNLAGAPTPRDKPSAPQGDQPGKPSQPEQPGQPPADNTPPKSTTPPPSDKVPPPSEEAPPAPAPKTGSNPGLNESDDNNTVNNNDGASDSRGQQSDPSGDAEKAKQQAGKGSQAKKDAADQAKSETSTDSGAGSEPQGPSSGSSSGDSTGSAGEDTGGNVWDN